MFLSVLLCAPMAVRAADHCTNPDEYTIDKRCYVTDEQKKEKPYSATVALIKKGDMLTDHGTGMFTRVYCSGTIVKRRGLTSDNIGYFVYTAKHCVSEDGNNIRNQIQIKTQSGKEFTATLVKAGDYLEKESITYPGDWAIYRILPNDTQSNSKFAVGDELENMYVKIDGSVGKQYRDARVIGYGSLTIASDAEIKDMKDKYIKFLEENDIDISKLDETQLSDYGLSGSGVVADQEGNKWLLKFKKAVWDTFLIVGDKALKVSYCAYSDDKSGETGNMNDCQSWEGNSGGGVFDKDGNLIGILTRGYSVVGDEHDHALATDNIDFKRFGRLGHKQK